MIHKIFTIYDDKAKAFLPPFHLPESGQAIRSFADCVNSLDHQFGKNPEDYTLFMLGHFDDSDARIRAEPPKSLGNGVQFVKPHELQAYAPEPKDETTIGNDAPVLSGAGSGNSA